MDLVQADRGRRGVLGVAQRGCDPAMPLLLVEDNAPLRQMLSWELSDLGYQIHAAGDCAEARALIARQPMRGALIDIRLPDGDGRELAAELAARAPGLTIVLMSGAHDLQPDPGLAPHIRAYLKKPVNLLSIHQLFVASGKPARASFNHGSPMP
ncbi:MAG: response regulator [Lamprobacter sp.]|uniref:response regulator n=1 Tax=Lamprobacter sp. TaxID=3100796 RepID=UPI002B25A519|nr:response regulator [Lamprobacter sp.]MEA3642415.1 response regulator [Lamprobacter sp.]